MTATRRTKRVAMLGAVVIVALFGYLLYGGLDKNVVYFLTPQELLAKGTRGMDVPVRLAGQVKPGSVQWNDTLLALHFTIMEGKTEIPVDSKGAPPQMFRAGMGVVVEGRYRSRGVFECTSLMVKHSNEYRPPKPGESPERTMRTLLKAPGA